ncbi:MAG: DUF177 domain-containing protein [Armatimonadetes bacterium]|nr:DUF177 domain-containing protein [Armatimonadota bacterium]
MKLDLTEVAGNIGKRHSYEIREECVEGEDLKCTEPIVGTVEFTNTGRLILARGGFSATVEMECGRCLERLIVPVEVKIEEQFPIANLTALLAGHEEEIPEEEKEPLFENNVFDLSEFIRQAILVEVPIQPLCNETCKGLCPTCGRNLNEGPCDCPVVVEASPFDKLRQLLEAKEEPAE